jgi:hypothetical protein
VLGAQAARAEVHLLLFAVNNQRNRVDVRRPLPVGVALGVAYIMAEHRRFTT